MVKQLSIYGGGTEGSEWVACSAKVFGPDVPKWWRRFDPNRIFDTLQAASDAVG